ncbi:hypothetical protein AHAS_Ahas11G0006700 [Arachis hypogaea]
MKRGDATSCSKGLGREGCLPHHRVAMMDSKLLAPHFYRWETHISKLGFAQKKLIFNGASSWKLVLYWSENW